MSYDVTLQVEVAVLQHLVAETYTQSQAVLHGALLIERDGALSSVCQLVGEHWLHATGECPLNLVAYDASGHRYASSCQDVGILALGVDQLLHLDTLNVALSALIATTLRTV